MKRFLCLFVAIVMCLMSIPAFAMSLSFEEIKNIIDSTAVDDVHMFTDMQHFSDGGINSDAAYISEGIALMWYEDIQQAEVLLFSSSNPKEGYKWYLAEAGMQYIRDAVLILSVISEYNAEPIFTFISTDSTHNAPLQYLSDHKPNTDSEKFADEVAAYIKNNIAENTETVGSEATEAKQEEYTALQRGDKGDAVVVLQKRLNELGYSVGTADGDFGGKTETAIKKFREINRTVYHELYDSEEGIADGAIQALLFSDKALYNLEVLKGDTIIDDVGFFKGSKYNKLSTNVFEDYSYVRAVDYDEHGYEVLPWLEKYDENEYPQLEINNWYLEITNVMKHAISVSVYDEKNSIVCDVFSDGKASTTRDVDIWLIDVLKSIPALKEAAEKNGYGFYATMEGFNFKSNYADSNGIVDLLDESNRIGIISEYESAAEMLDAMAILESIA